MNEFSYNEQDHKYFLGDVEIPGVTRTIDEAGLSALPPGINLALIKQKLAQGESLTPIEDVWVRAGKFGLAVHEACRLYDLNTLNEKKLDVKLVGWLEGWKKFRYDFGIMEFEAIELKVCSRRWKFGGRLDRIANIKKRTEIDIKTPTMKKRATGVQLAGYQEAWQEMTKKKIRQRWAVHLCDGGYNLEVCDDPSDRDVFLACLQHNRAQIQIDNWKRRM